MGEPVVCEQEKGPSTKSSVNQYPISIILAWIEQGDIAIPEIQCLFAWSKTQVRDLMDSLLNGLPGGYLIAWRNPNIKQTWRIGT